MVSFTIRSERVLLSKFPSFVGRKRGRLTHWQDFLKRTTRSSMGKPMKIWIDLGNSPHVPFFLALSKEFENRGHGVVWTARDYAQTVPLAEKAKLPIEIFGTHGGKGIFQKGMKFTHRSFELIRWLRGKKIDLVVSHNSHEPLAVARVLGINSVNLMDYEHHPMNHLSFRFAKRVVVPESFPIKFLEKFGAGDGKTKRFPGIKEDVYLADFESDPRFSDELLKYGISSCDVLVVVRPHAPEALYHRQFSNEIINQMLDIFAKEQNVKILLLPRKDLQREQLRLRHPQPNIIIPDSILDGANLIAAADLVVSGGGTMNREAAALGVPVVTIFAGNSAAIDEFLINEGRLVKVETLEDIKKIQLKKKTKTDQRRAMGVKKQVADFILENW